jgi:threonine dehydrogenase-like Zn-dependent dehydrogenase
MTTKSMRAAVLWDVARMDVRDVPCPDPGPRDVRLRVTAVGLCGTDFHIFEGHGNYHTDERGRRVPLAEHPQILGHEVVGIVDEAGPEVAGLRRGDRVVLDQGRNCASAGLATLCEYCATGDSHQCEHYQEHGITGLPGGLAEALVVPAVNVVRASSDLPSTEAVLTEPLACIVHAVDAAQRAGGRYTLDGSGASRAQTVLIAGGGPAGLLFLQYLRQVLGFEGRVLVSEPDASKRRLAATLGGETIDPADGRLVEVVLDRTSGRRAEWVIEASGASRVLVDLSGLMRKQATLLLYGHGHTGLDIGVFSNIQFKEPTLVTPVGASGPLDPDGRPSVHRRALRLLEEGRVTVGAFLTHHYRSLDAVPAAFAGEHRTAGYIKGVVELAE